MRRRRKEGIAMTQWISDRWLLVAVLAVLAGGPAMVGIRTRTGLTVGLVALRALVHLAARVARWFEILHLALDSFAVRWALERQAEGPRSEIEAVMGGAAKLRPTGLERMGAARG